MAIWTYVRNADPKSKLVAITLEGGLILRIGTYANLSSGQLEEIRSSGSGVVIEEGIIPPATPAGGSSASSSTVIFPFEPLTTYKKGQAIFQAGAIYIAKENFVSGETFETKNWEVGSSSGGVTLAEKGASGGVATLNSETKIPIAQIPKPNAGGYFEATFGNASATSFTVEHKLNTLTPNVNIVNQSTSLEEGCKVEVINANKVKLSATAWEATPPGNAAYRVSVDASSGLVNSSGSALTNFVEKGEVGANSGVAPLSSEGIVPLERLKSVTTGNTIGTKVSPFSVAQIWSPGSSTDCGPRIQEAVDSGATRIKLEGNTLFFLNSAVFDDSEVGIGEGPQDRQVIIEGNNQTRLSLGSGLPTTTAFSDTATKWGFFSGTKRTALSSGVVTCNNSTAVNGSQMNAGPRMVFKNLILDGKGTNTGLCFGNHAPNEIDHCTQRGLKFGLSWTGYCDGNKVSSIVTHENAGAAEAGSISGTWLIYQITNGDRVVVENIENGSSKNFGTWRAAQCRAGLVKGIVAGKIELNHSSGIVIDSGHTELTEQVFKPSIVINNSDVTIKGYNWFAGLESERYFIEINDDNAGSAVGSSIKLDGCRSVYYPLTKDTERAADIYINAINPNSRIVIDNSDATILPLGSTVEYQGSLIIKSAVTAVTTALVNSTYTAFNKAIIASPRWELYKEGSSWILSSSVKGITSYARQTSTPTFALQASTVWEGTLTNGTSYSYAAAGIDDSGRHTSVSTASELAATSLGAIYVEVTITAAPLGIIVWRKEGAGVLTAPTSYAVLPVGTILSRLIDTGTHINGIAWVLTSVPVPNTSFVVNNTCSGLKLSNGVELLSGAGTPNAAEVTAPVGSIYTATTGAQGAVSYVKVSGSSINGWQIPRDLHVTTISANYTTTGVDGMVDASAASEAIEVKLSNMENSLITAGHELSIKKTDSTTNLVTIKCAAGGATIDGFASYILTKKNQVVTLVSNGSSYEVKSSSQDESNKLSYPTSWPVYKGTGSSEQENKPVVAEPFPRWRVQAEIALVSGTPIACAITVPAHVTISGIVWFINTAEGTPANRTHLWGELLSSAGLVLRKTEDYTSSTNSPMTGGTRRGLLFTSSFETIEPTLLYAVINETMSSTSPIKIAGTTGTTGVFEAPPILYATGTVGQTTPPETGTSLTLTAAGNAPYLALI